MRRRIAILAVAGAIVLLGVGIGLWFATMPYPIEVWWEACWSVHYAHAWPVSESDFAVAKDLVKSELGWREIIVDVAVMGPDEIKMLTVLRWGGPVSRNGSLFVIRKVNGEWEIARRKAWYNEVDE